LAKEWIEPQDTALPEGFQEALGGHPLVAQTLARRGISSPTTARAFLDPRHYQPTPASDLPGLPVATERLRRAIRQGQRVCVWGDFDVDGQTATTILVSTLRDLGASVTFHIPHREREGHGIRRSVLRGLIAEGMDLLLTCDTGITALEAIEAARAEGVDVIITDHHELPPDLPEAVAVVNPKLLPDGHPLRELPGAGVAYKLAEALYAAYGRDEDAARHLDLVALGIVADVAIQRADVRYLLQCGLKALRHTERLGLQEMMALAEVTCQWLTEEHIGFALAPRLNALGRLADAQVAVELLTTRDRTRARILAAELEGLNAQRRLLVKQVMQGALAQIERNPALLDSAALVLAHPSWPGGVIGIVAGRLAERFNRPTVLLATPPDEAARGSARSVEGCNITAALAAHSELLQRFGGHPQAAGLTIEQEGIPQFRQALSATVQQMRGEVREPVQHIDAVVRLKDLSLDLVQEIERLAPFGPGNPPLVLMTRRVVVLSSATVGRTEEHRIITVEDEGGISQRAIWWQGADWPVPEGRFDLAYAVRASDYRGQRDVQVEWIDARPAGEPAVTVQAARAAPKVVDYRRMADPQRVLARLRAEVDVLVWAEATARVQVSGADRRELEPSAALAIWTTPPGPDELRAALTTAAPQTVYLFGIDPGLDDAQVLLGRLAGLVKRAIHAAEGRVSLSTLAAATAQRVAVVRLGLAWLQAGGAVAILAEEGDELLVGDGHASGSGDAGVIMTRLTTMLRENAAYRTYFARADAETLIDLS
jgi:single-stranded-DNA-specific exonuclease